MTFLFRLAILFYFLSFDLNAQTFDKIEFIKNLSDYRTSLLEKESVNNQFIKQTFEKWQRLEPDLQKRKDFLFNVTYWTAVADWPLATIFSDVKKRSKKSTLAREFTYDELIFISKNYDLIDLINDEVLKPKYPFVINKNQLFEELAFYGILRGDIISELGAGGGEFSFILTLMGLDLHIYINEIKKWKLDYINDKFANRLATQNNPNVFTILGSRSDTEIPRLVDKVIIRNSFHHFGKQKKMLASIERILKPDGQVLIMDYPKGFHDDCGKRISADEVISAFTSNDFDLIEKQFDDGRYLLKFAKQN